MKTSVPFVTFAGVVFLLFSAPPARADQLTWTLAGTGDWSVGTNWSEGHVPTSTDWVNIENGGTVTISQSGTTYNYYELSVGTSGRGTVNMTGGSLPQGVFAIYVGGSGTGTFSQSGGTITSGGWGLSIGANGTYILSNTALLSEGIESVDGSPGGFSSSPAAPTPFPMTSGSPKAPTRERITSAAGASGRVYAEDIGRFGSGTFTQTGGTNCNNNQMILGENPGTSGVYNFNGGVLLMQAASQDDTLLLPSLSGGSGTAAFNFGGGTLQVVGSLPQACP